MVRSQSPDVLIKGCPGKAENAANRRPASAFLNGFQQGLYPVQVQPGRGQDRHGGPGVRSRGPAAVTGRPADSGAEHGSNGVMIGKRPPGQWRSSGGHDASSVRLPALLITTHPPQDA
jgi:hypothetical protein